MQIYELLILRALAKEMNSYRKFIQFDVLQNNNGITPPHNKNRMNPETQQVDKSVSKDCLTNVCQNKAYQKRMLENIT